MNKWYLKAEENYTEFCKKFNGVDFSAVVSIARDMHLSFGAQVDEKMVDVNYKNILATCVNRNGKSVVSKCVEIYDDEGGFITTYNI